MSLEGLQKALTYSWEFLGHKHVSLPQERPEKTISSHLQLTLRLSANRK